MKNIYLVLLGLLFLVQAAAQKGAERQLIWSIGDVEMVRGKEIRVTYPLMVAISDGADSPELGSSTMRLFYDAGQLSDPAIEAVANNYQVSGLNRSNDVYGDIFGFVGGGGVFVQFNLMANEADLLAIAEEPVRVMDLSFKVVPGAKIPLCVPLVLDNNPEGTKRGPAADAGFLLNDSGISGTYFLNRQTNAVHLADDEVRQYLWERNPAFDNLVDELSDRAGVTVKLKANTCLEPQRPVRPAEMDRFDAWKEAKGQVRLKWNTRSEFNNDRFEVQRSADGFSYETIEVIAGQWNTVEPTDYAYLDKQALPGINYYRLVQFDNNDRTQYSSVREVEFETSVESTTGNWEVSYYPNPSRGMVRLSSDRTFLNFDLEIYDAEGRMVMKKNNISANELLDLTELSTGVYSLTLLDRNGQTMNTRQIVINGR